MKTCNFPIKEFREIFPNARVKDVKHIASQGEWEREHILWIYGEVKPPQYPKEWKKLKPKLDEWARCKKK